MCTPQIPTAQKSPWRFSLVRSLLLQTRQTAWTASDKQREYFSMHHTVVEREPEPSSRASLCGTRRKTEFSTALICIKVDKCSVLLAACAHAHDTYRQLVEQLLVRLCGTRA